MPVTYYKATFGNGQVRTRSTETRLYRYAYLAVGSSRDGRTWSAGGWSSSETLARKALTAEINGRIKPHYHSPDYYGVVPAVPISKHEFLDLKAHVVGRISMTKLNVLMRVIGFADGDIDCPIAGQWLESFDHEAENGLGAGVFTDDPDKAMKFATVSAALEFWKRQSKIKPLRDTDGKANRPLTATTVTFDHMGKPKS